MGVPKEHVLAILAQNIAIRRSVFPLASRHLTAWARGLGLKRGGPRVLYTGHMYQLVPFIKATARREHLREKKVLAGLMPIGRLLNPIFNLSSLVTLAGVERGEVEYYNSLLGNIACLLQKAGVEFGYLYEHEEYAGALAYDLGLDDAFEKHAVRLFAKMKDLGVQELITVDPHTTDILKNVYPRVVDGFDIRVENYLDLLARRAGPEGKKRSLDRGEKGKVVLHDSCVYARSLSFLETPRDLLEMSGVEVIEPDLSGVATHCCGGPLESFFPQKAMELARERASQLVSAGDPGEIPTVVTMCPICHLNLDKAAGPEARVMDVVEILARTSA